MREIPIYYCVGGSPRWPHTLRFAVAGHATVDDLWFHRLTAMGMWMEVRDKCGLRYARLQGTGGPGTKKVHMHQVVAGFNNADHRDGNGWNNQSFNLRFANSSQQKANQRLHFDSTSGEPGVSWRKDIQKWWVRVYKDHKCVFRKLFTSLEEAVQTARQKRQEIHGEFVRAIQ